MSPFGFAMTSYVTLLAGAACSILGRADVSPWLLAAAGVAFITTFVEAQG